MPTRVLAAAPFTPLMLPSTMALFSPTKAFAPIAVALLSVPVEAQLLAPKKVSFEPVINDLSNVSPAWNPLAVFWLPAVLDPSATAPVAVFCQPMVLTWSASMPVGHHGL